MPKFLRKTILILSVVFAVFYVWFNFGFIIFETGSLLGLISDTPADLYEPDEDGAVAYLFPLSQDKHPAIADGGAPQNAVAVKKTGVTIQPAIKSSFLLSVPSLGINAPVVLEPTISEDRIYKQLEKGVVHYAETPLPGQKGTSVIIGHSSVYPWYKGKYGQIFASLSKLQEGDVIQIESEGNILNYRVARSLIFSPSSADDFELRSLEYSEGSSIVLMTCWPTGTNSKRVAVRADLVI